MFYLNKDTPLTQALLQKMINCFRITVEPRLTNYKNYYDGLQAILNKAYSDPTKPCNRTVINYCKNIVDSYCGYMAAPNCISYYSDADIDDIMNILRYNDYQAEDSELLLNALIYGVACELMYIDSESNTRFRIIDPTTCFGVYDDSLTSDLMYFVRIYKVNEWDNNNQYCVDVYDSNTVKHYTMVGENSFLTFNGEEPHYFGQCPANIFVMPDEKSIFDCILTLQDTVNELLSAEVDDYSAFCDAYLLLQGVDADNRDIASMKENRVILLPDANSNASWLTKSSNDTQVENILKRLHDSIYRISACVDFSSETFTGGVSSGIAIQFKLSGMEQRAGNIESLMKKALQRRIEIICGMAALATGDDVWRDIQINFVRNIPADENATINMINALKGTVSDATLLAQVPFITDVQAELDAVAEQKKSNMELYGFGFNSGTDSNEEDEDGNE